MSYFTYQARDRQGKTIKGLVEAPSEQVAARLLRDKQLFVVNVAPQAKEMTFDTLTNFFTRVGFRDIVNFTRQMATLSVAGLSIPESLAIMRSQTTNSSLIEMFTDIEHHVVSGGNLANALSRHATLFPSVYIALIRAGEASGTLDRVLSRMAETLENEMEFKAKVRSAMIYPTIIIIGMVIVVFIMMTVVVPKLTELYTDFGVELPFATRILVTVSQLFVHYWFLMILGIVGGLYGLIQWKKTPYGALFIDTITLKIPLTGDLQQKVILAEFTRTLGMLITSGIHILDALTYLKDSTGNVLYRNAIIDLTKKVEKGFPLGETFGQYEVFPMIVAQMVKVGEETGKLDETLGKLSLYFEREADHLLKNLTTAIEPIIMVVLGLGVGFIVFSIITPIYSLTNQIK